MPPIRVSVAGLTGLRTTLDTAATVTVTTLDVTPPAVAVMFVEPSATAVTKPDVLTVAALSFVDAHVNVVTDATTAPPASYAVAVS